MPRKKLTQEEKDAIDAEWHMNNSAELEMYLFGTVAERRIDPRVVALSEHDNGTRKLLVDKDNLQVYHIVTV